MKQGNRVKCPLLSSYRSDHICLWRAAWPLGAVTSQALHTFTLQGQIPVTEPGGQKPTWTPAPHHLRKKIKALSRHLVLKCKIQTWRCPSSGCPLQMRVSKAVRQTSGLQRNTWAIHYPPTNPLWMQAPQKLHINPKKLLTSPLSLLLPLIPV